MIRRLLSAFVGLSAAVALAGCGKGDGREGVSGSVTVKGVPLKEGSISFQPADGQSTAGGAGIKDGKYEIPKSAGLLPGKYLVRLTAGDGKTPDASEEAGGPGGSTNIVSVDLIPAEYGYNSKQQFEVKAGVENKYDIDLPYLNDPKGKKKR